MLLYFSGVFSFLTSKLNPIIISCEPLLYPIISDVTKSYEYPIFTQLNNSIPNTPIIALSVLQETPPHIFLLYSSKAFILNCEYVPSD